MTIGDEFYHYYIDENGSRLKLGNDGFLRPCDENEIEQHRTDSPLLAKQEYGRKRLREARPLNRADEDNGDMPQHGVGLFTYDYPTTGEVRSLVFLVEYQDIKFTTPNPREYFSASLNEEGFSKNGATGSARDYFLEESAGDFRPIFDVYGPVTLANKRTYYGGNDHNGWDKHPEEMVLEAAAALADVIDFSQYDFDNNGFVDNLYVIYAGAGEASSPEIRESVWPHNSAIFDGPIYNGKQILKYACSNEITFDKPTGIGTFCHEYSHVLGLPDLYCTSGTLLNCTPDRYSLLDQGNYNNYGRTPPHYSSFERNALRWMKPTVLRDAASITLEPLGQCNTSYLIETANDNEFFLIENRQQEGSDRYIPGHGMLIWHIHFSKIRWDYNQVNNSQLHQYVDIVEACGRTGGNYYASYPFPGAMNVTSFTADTKPAMESWAKTPIDMPITDITENEDGTVSFNVKGGTNSIGNVGALHGRLQVSATSLTLSLSGEAFSPVRILTAVGKEQFCLALGSDGKARCKLPTAGFYIVVSNHGTTKIMVK